MRPRRQNLIRNPKITIQTLQAIANEPALSLRQIQYACRHRRVAEAKSLGRPLVLSSESVDELEQFVCDTRDCR